MRHQRRTRHSYKTILIAVSCMAGMLTLPQQLRAQTGSPTTLNLAQAIDLALKQNRSLHLAQLSVTDYQHKKEAARAAYFPHISNSSNFHHITEFAGVEIPAGAFGVPASTGPIPAKPLFLDQGG